MEDVGYAVMSATTFQTGSIERKVWTEAMTVPRVELRSDSKATPAAILAIYQNGLSGGVVGTSGNIAVHMQRKNGKWYYNIVGILTQTMRAEDALMDSDDGLPGKPPHPRIAIGRDVSGFIYKSYGAPIRYINCDIMTDHSEENKQKVVERQQGYEKRFADANASKSSDGYMFPSLAMLKAARYTGSLADFSKVLSDLVKAAFSNGGSGSSVNYGPEIDFILLQARTCPTVSARVNATAPAGKGMPLHAPGSYDDKQADLFKACSADARFEAMKYVDAVSGDSVDPSDKPGTKRDLLVVVSPDYYALWGGEELYGESFLLGHYNPTHPLLATMRTRLSRRICIYEF